MNRSHDLMNEVMMQLRRIGPEGCFDPALKDALLPDRREITLLLQELQTILFPRFFPHPRTDSLEDLLERVHRRLMEQVALALPFGEPWSCDANCVGKRFLLRLPVIKELLYKDIQAIYDGDPAARTAEEIVLCYPGFFAALIYRLAHELYRLNVPLLPRIMTEYAHQKTGIDIHAGAQIGEYFCIDHGTGVVIGETATIGHHVKLYQGVTIGAKSFELDPDGNPVKGIKRHPDIGNHVVIYSGATILGGDTVIGDHVIIGGNAWIISSVPPHTTVYFNGRDSVEKTASS
jgi:serine O-acetyltransferase